MSTSPEDLMTKNSRDESGKKPRGQKVHPPAWAPWLLALALPVAVVLELLALVVAGLVLPLFDLTPIFVLVVAFLSRRWVGVSAKWFRAPAILSALLLIQWIAWDVWYYYVVFQGSLSTYGFDQLVKRFGNPLVALLLVEMVALLILFGRASVLSYKGVKKARAQG
jgi:hypothetical protein